MEYFGCHGIRKSCGTFLHYGHKYGIMTLFKAGSGRMAILIMIAEQLWYIINTNILRNYEIFYKILIK